MKKVFFIITKDSSRWEQVFPDEDGGLPSEDYSVLFLGEKDKPSRFLPPKKWRFLQEKDDIGGQPEECPLMTYQEFLEQVFSADLSLVI